MTTAFNLIRRFVLEASGLSLDDDKRYLVEDRLAPLMRQAKLASLEDLASLVASDPRSDLAQAVAETLTINETSFFRDRPLFSAFTDMVPAEARGGARRAPQAAHLVRRLLERAGAVLARHAARRAGAQARRMASRDPGDRPVAHDGRDGATGVLQPVRGATRRAGDDAAALLPPRGRALADQRPSARQGDVPHAKPRRGRARPRPVRRHILPQRPHLFRRRDQAARAREPGCRARRRWRARAGRRRSRRRPQ